MLKLLALLSPIATVLVLSVPSLIQAPGRAQVRIPNIDPAAYLPPREAGPTITISLSRVTMSVQNPTVLRRLQAARDNAAKNNDIGVLINAANAELTTLKGGTLAIEGGGSVKTLVHLDHHTKFDSSTYACDITGFTDNGVFLVGDGALIEGTYKPPQALLDYFRKGNGRDFRDPYLLAVQALTRQQLAGTGTTILEPTFVNGQLPAVEVFQAAGDACCSHTGKSRDIAVIGFHFKGRQQVYDGGISQTIVFGNCERCSAQNNYLEDTASIGIQFGGSALEKNNYANNVLAYHNITSGVAAANIAAVNAENAYIIENYAMRPGHHDPPYGGGVCGFDLETNTPSDHSKNIFVVNNLYDYEGGHISWGTGNAICLQDPHTSANRGLVVAVNNVIIGGRNDRNPRYLSNGLFLNGLLNCQIVNNYVYRTGQDAIQAYTIHGCVIEGNDFESTGGGGNPTVQTINSENNTFRRNKYRSRPGLEINVDSTLLEKCGKNNVYQDNLTDGRPANIVKVPCGG